MPDVDITIGGRNFKVACQEGEEHFLRAAAQLLDAEAQTLADALGRIPESRMLLMAGLMLADKTAGLEEELRRCETKVRDLQAAPPARPAPPAPERVEVPVEVKVVPEALKDELDRIAARAEEVAEQVEKALNAG